MYPSGIISEIIELEEVDSTNRYALDSGRPGLLVRAHIQTAGRGRRGRTWFSPAGENLYMTITLAPPEPRYPIIAGVAVRAALADLVGRHNVAIKWPNDIVVSGKKVCGILCEMKSGITAVGIGVNVNQEVWPAELGERSVSLNQVSHHRFSVDEVARAVANKLGLWVDVFRSRGFSPVRDEFLCHGLLEGYEVFDEKGKRCTIVDLTAEGHLVIDIQGVRRILIHEPVSLGWDMQL